MKKKLLTVKQTAKISGRTSNTIRIWIRKGKLKAVKEKGVWMIDPEILSTMVETLEQIEKDETVVTEKPGIKRRTRKLPQTVAGKSEDDLREAVKALRKETEEIRSELADAVKKVNKLTHEIEELRVETESLRSREERQKDNINSILGPLAPLVEKLLGL